jgi:hypothetical protein
VIDPENKDYFLEDDRLRSVESRSEEIDDNDDQKRLEEDHDVSLDTQRSKSSQIDVTSAYLTLIRLYARLRGEKGAAANARSVLDRMHVVHDAMTDGMKGNADDTSNSIAFVDIRANAYNLVLGMYRDSKFADDATNALELLTRMIDAGKKGETERNGVPLPTLQSFEYAILSLAKMADSDDAIREAERLIVLMEETEYLERSITVYNALLTLCTKTLYGKPELYDKAIEVVNKLNGISKQYSELTPNSETMSLVIKACAHSKRDDNETVLSKATTIFSELVAQEKDERSSLALSDSSYLYMMMCVMNHMTGDDERKKDHIEELFSQACQRGLCSSAILTLFRNNSSEENYRLTVGKGRLADNWIANVTSPRALYTDGSAKGAGKNARRHGKSTSNWAKKQQEKDSKRKVIKDSKRAKNVLLKKL